MAIDSHEEGEWESFPGIQRRAAAEAPDAADAIEEAAGDACRAAAGAVKAGASCWAS